MGSMGLPEPRYAVVDGLRLQYFEWDNQGKPTLLWLHGGGGHPVNWAQNIEHFKDAYHCLALTQRGHSGSEWATPERYAPGCLANEIALFLDALGITKVSIIGSSSGGMTAVLFAATRPERMEKLVFTEMPPVLGDEWLEFTKQYLGKMQSEFSSLEKLCEWVRETHDPTMSDDKLKAYASVAAQELPNGMWTFKHDVAFERVEFETYLKAARDLALGRRPDPDNWHLLTQVACPTLIIRGDKSNMLDTGTMQRMIAFMPNARGAVLDAGHVVYADKPDEFNILVEGFLRTA